MWHLYLSDHKCILYMFVQVALDILNYLDFKDQKNIKQLFHLLFDLFKQTPFIKRECHQTSATYSIFSYYFSPIFNEIARCLV